MVFKQWYKVVGHDISGYSKVKFHNINLSRNRKNGEVYDSLSPITVDLLNTWTNLINKDKNLIFNFPENVLRPAPLLAYSFSRITDKSTLIFTSGNFSSNNKIIKLHNQNAQLMGYQGSDYLYNITPVGIVKSDSLNYDPYLLHATNMYKKKHKKRLRDDLLKSDKPKILFNSSDKFKDIFDVLENIDKKQIKNLKNTLDIGCIIFENADRFINSKSMINKFVKRLNEYINKDTLLLFHFSKPKLNFLPEFKEKTNSLILDYSNAILRNNRFLNKISVEYFKTDFYNDNSDILDMYNLDLIQHHKLKSNMSLIEPALDSGNLDNYFYYARKCLDAIDETTIENKVFYRNTIRLIYSLYNLAINPSFFKFNFQVSKKFYRYINVLDFIELYNDKLNGESKDNQLILSNLISNLKNIYYELAHCKNYFEENNYQRICKNYKILDIANNKNSYFHDNKKLVIGTYQVTEEAILNNLLSDIDDIEAIHLKKLNKSSRDFSQYNLLLPGIISNKFSFVLEHKFNKIKVLAYSGFNKNLIKKEINNVFNPPITLESTSMEYFDEIYQVIDKEYGDFFKDYERRFNKFIKKQEELSNILLEFLNFINPGDMFKKEKGLPIFDLDLKIDKLISNDLIKSNEEYYILRNETIIQEFFAEFSSDIKLNECKICGILSKDEICPKCVKKAESADNLKQILLEVDPGINFRFDDLNKLDITVRNLLIEFNLIKKVSNDEGYLVSEFLLNKYFDETRSSYTVSSIKNERIESQPRLQKICNHCQNIKPIFEFNESDICIECEEKNKVINVLFEVMEFKEFEETFKLSELVIDNIKSKINKLREYGLVKYNLFGDDYYISNEMIILEFIDKNSLNLSYINIALNEIDNVNSFEELSIKSKINVNELKIWYKLGQKGYGRYEEFYEKYRDTVIFNNLNSEEKMMVTFLKEYNKNNDEILSKIFSGVTDKIIEFYCNNVIPHYENETTYFVDN